MDGDAWFLVIVCNVHNNYAIKVRVNCCWLIVACVFILFYMFLFPKNTIFTKKLNDCMSNVKNVACMLIMCCVILTISVILFVLNVCGFSMCFIICLVIVRLDMRPYLCLNWLIAQMCCLLVSIFTSVINIQSTNKTVISFTVDVISLMMFMWWRTLVWVWVRVYKSDCGFVVIHFIIFIFIFFPPIWRRLFSIKYCIII